MLAQEELGDDLLIGLKLDHSYPVKIVNKKNSQHKSIIKLVNLSIEHGILNKRNNLFVYGMLNLCHLLQNIAHRETIEIFRKITKKSLLITINQLESLLLLFLIGIIISIFLFIIEIVYFIAR